MGAAPRTTLGTLCDAYREFVGTVFAVTDMRGDTYTESITRWDPESILEIRMDGFVKPLSSFSTHFFERWTIEREFASSTNDSEVPVVVRSFEMYPKSRITRPALWFIGQMMRRAVDRHSARMLA